MAVTDIANSNLTFTGVPLGVQVTKVTDSSADWASVANSTYFYDKTDKLIHFKNSGGTVLEIFSAAGLTYFTEAEATTSPNNTVYVDSLTAAGSTTNADVAIVPKGSGAFMLAIPDNTATGGNKRGQYAVDLQFYRTAASQVASGNYSVVVGTGATASAQSAVAIGGNATASGTNSLAMAQSTASGVQSISIGLSSVSSSTRSIAIGDSCTASGANAVAIGVSNTSSGGGAFTSGYLNNSTGSYSSAIGYGNTSSGFSSVALGTSNSTVYDFNYAIGNGNSLTSGPLGNNSYVFAFGLGNTVNAGYATAIGCYGLTNGVTGRQTFSSGRIATNGDAQKSTFFYRGRTTDATLTVLATDASNSINISNCMQLANNSSIRFKGTISGKQSGSTNIAAWDVDGLIVRGASAAATTLTIGNVNLVSNIPGWGTPVLSTFIDAFNGVGALRIQIQGAAATNIQWTAVIETTEVIYA